MLALLALSWGTLAAAKLADFPVLLPRTVTSLDSAAVAEAQQRDDTATRAFSNIQITTSDGRCLFVDKLSGDFRENLTPVQVAACGSTDGQGWDIITAGKHNNAANSALLVSTLTQACFNFDPRRAAGNQVLLFSCGGRADGGGLVTNSQLFSFNGTAGPLALEPENAPGSCMTVKGNVIDVANCDAADSNQSFVFGSAAASVSTTASTGSSATGIVSSVSANTGSPASSTTETSSTFASSLAQSLSCPSQRTRTVTTTVTKTSKATATSIASLPVSGEAGVALGAAVVSSSTLAATVASSSTFAVSGSVITGTVTAIAVPDTAVPVSRGGEFSPTAAAEANQRDNTASRAFSNVTIRAPNGQCLFIDPTAGDFRENLIPVSLVECSGTPNEKWDVITAGEHNDVQGTALLVSTLTNGCLSFDSRRATNDTVTMFACGGRADGSGQTNADQLMPFNGAFSFAFAPSGENGAVCLLPGDGRLISGACPTDGSQLFSIFP